MSGPSFTQVFGGSTIYPAQPTFISIALATDIILSWPIEIAPPGMPVVADIVEVAASADGLTISLEDAQQTSTGYTALFNNIGAHTFTVLDALGNVLMAVASGQVWQIYLADNSTVQGTFRIFQYGAGVSSANASALAGAGLKAITTTLNERIAVNAQSANYVSTIADRAVCIEWTGGTGTIQLPAAGTVGSDWFVLIKNAGTGIVTVSPPSGTIDQNTSLAFSVDDSAILVCDGTNYFTVGFGQAVNSAFDFLQIDLTGDSGNVVLTGAQLNRISYRFTGAIAGNINIIVPNTVQQYWIDNETTGAFSLTVKTAAGTGIAVSQGTRNILYSDGTNVTNAVSFGSTGFADGSAAAPSIFFTSTPGTGLFKSGTNSLGFSTAGVSRGGINAKGQWTIGTADDATSPTLTVAGYASPTGGSPALLVTTPFPQTSVQPGILLANGAGGFSILSIRGSANAPGTDDLGILQDGTSLNGQIINRSTTGSLILGTNNTDRLIITSAGAFQFDNTTVAFTATAGTNGAPPAQVAGYLACVVNGIASKIPYYAV